MLGLSGAAGLPESLPGGPPGEALRQADLLVGGRRLLDAVSGPARAGLTCRRVEIAGGLERALDAIAHEPGRVCVLASGDPGFFGIVRPLAERFGPESLDVHPSPSSVSLAFARLGLPWDDAVVVSAHGRPLEDAVQAVIKAPKAAVLVSPEAPPEALARELVKAGAAFSSATVCSAVGTAGESVATVSLADMASRSWDPLSVVVLLDGTGPRAVPTLEWGLPGSAFEHRASMLTKPEIRSVVLGKLQLPASGVLWDVGAGSGSVAIECAGLCPGLDVYAVEKRADDARRILSNAERHSAAVTVVHGRAPDALAALPDPDRVFVGGGGTELLGSVIDRLSHGGRVVATYAALERASQAAAVLGEIAQVSVSVGRRLPDGGLRLEAENPVFVAWGPR